MPKKSAYSIYIISFFVLIVLCMQNSLYILLETRFMYTEYIILCYFSLSFCSKYLQIAR